MTLKNCTSIVKFWWSNCPYYANSWPFSLTYHFQANKTAGGRGWEWDADTTASVPLQISKVAAGQHPVHIWKMSLQSSTQWMHCKHGHLKNLSTHKSVGISPSDWQRPKPILSGINKSSQLEYLSSLWQHLSAHKPHLSSH